jgi:hypothetical protein
MIDGEKKTERMALVPISSRQLARTSPTNPQPFQSIIFAHWRLGVRFVRRLGVNSSQLLAIAKRSSGAGRQARRTAALVRNKAAACRTAPKKPLR